VYAIRPVPADPTLPPTPCRPRPARSGAAAVALIVLIALVVLVVLATSGGLAVAATAPATGLSLAEALARAADNPSVAAARALAAAEAARVDAARAPGNPLLSLGTTRYSGKELVEVSEDLRWAGQRHWAVAAALGSAAAQSERAALRLLEMRHAVRRAWLALAGAEERAALAERILERAHELTTSTAARVDAGRAPRLDLLRAQAEEALLQARAATATEDRRAAWAALALLDGLDPSADGRTDGALPPAPTPEALASVRAADLARHPALAAAAAEVDAARAAATLERRRRLPGLSLALGLTAGDPGLPGTDRSAALGLTVPLGSPGAAAEREARARQAAAEAAYAAALREQAAMREEAYHRALGAQAQLQAYRSAALPAAEQAATLTREAYVAGRGDLVRVIEADRALLEAEIGQLDARLELALAEADLKLATGVDE